MTVVLGPAAVTASALDQANAAPPHHAAEAGRPRALGTDGRVTTDPGTALTP
ncbi:hypothetical protein ACWDE9_21920 [Streptomyces olivaceoviridis]